MSRPKKDKTNILKKIKPFLLDGMTRERAILESGISRATFYRVLKRDSGFKEKIEFYENKTIEECNLSIVSILKLINEKVDMNITLRPEEFSFLKWFLENRDVRYKKIINRNKNKKYTEKIENYGHEYGLDLLNEEELDKIIFSIKT